MLQLFSRRSNLRQYRNEVFFITANDNPCERKEDRIAAIQRQGLDFHAKNFSLRIKDLDSEMAHFECLAMSLPGLPPFDLSNFYNEFYGETGNFGEHCKAKLGELGRSIR